MEGAGFCIQKGHSNLEEKEEEEKEEEGRGEKSEKMHWLKINKKYSSVVATNSTRSWGG